MNRARLGLVVPDILAVAVGRPGKWSHEVHSFTAILRGCASSALASRVTRCLFRRALAARLFGVAGPKRWAILGVMISVLAGPAAAGATPSLGRWIGSNRQGEHVSFDVERDNGRRVATDYVAYSNPTMGVLVDGWDQINPPSEAPHVTWLIKHDGHLGRRGSNGALLGLDAFGPPSRVHLAQVTGVVGGIRVHRASHFLAVRDGLWQLTGEEGTSFTFWVVGGGTVIENPSSVGGEIMNGGTECTIFLPCTPCPGFFDDRGLVIGSHGELNFPDAQNTGSTAIGRITSPTEAEGIYRVRTDLGCDSGPLPFTAHFLSGPPPVYLSAPGSQLLQPPSNKFDAAGAAAWARANATRNSNPYGYSNDCTDFVSRAMHLGGGMPERDGQGGPFPLNHTDDRDWYMRRLGVGPVGKWVGTYSWGDSLHLRAFLTNAGLPRQVSLQAARPGDVIFVNWGKGGRDLPHGQTDTTSPGGISHDGMIVGNPGSRRGYDVLIAQHTNNTIERLSDWRKPNPHLHFWIYSVYYH